MSTPLIQAAMEGKQTEVEKLIAEGADLNAKTPGGLTALHWAVIRGHFGIVKTLVEKKADLTVKTPSGMTPLDEALVRGRLNVVKLLDEHGVNVTSEFNQAGDLPIHTAAREGFLPILKYLCEVKKVDVMQNNQKENKRPLNISRQSLHDRPNEPQHKECVHYLFDLDETG